MAELTDTDVRETVRERYAAAATRSGRGRSGLLRATAASMLRGRLAGQPTNRREVVRRRALRGGEPTTLPTALDGSLGCGVPTAVAELHEGETVLDLGSGGGADVLISAAASGRPARRSAST